MTADVLENFKTDTERYIELYCEKYQIENLRIAPPNTFEGALNFAGDRIFLKTSDKMLKYNRQTIINCDDITELENVYDFYYFLCETYDKEVTIQGFSKYTKISEQTLYNWLNGVYKNKIYLDKDGNVIEDIQEWKLNRRGEYREVLSTAHLDFVKKIMSDDEHTLANVGIGNRNNTGIAMKLNTKFNWNAPNGRNPEAEKNRVLSVSELPKLGEIGGEN